MNFKKNLKRFMTLNRHHAEGFTLVELIVVIAILAILGGVAVPAYGGYVKKANMTADQQLASEVANALTLYYYSHPNEAASGYVVLSTDGADGDGTVGNAAMQAVFGDSWQDVATLKYDGWTVNSAMLTTALNNPHVGDSSYLQNSTVDELLGNVQTVTNAAAGMLGNLTQDADHYLNVLEMTLGEGYMEDAVAAGVMKKDENGEYQFASGVTADGKIGTDLQNQLSNLMVLSVANELQGADGATVSQMMLGGLADGVDNPSGFSDASNMAAKYALFKAYSLEEPSAAADFEEMNNALASATGTSDVNAAFQNFYNKHKTGMDNIDPNVFMANANAIPSIMKGVNDTSGDYLNADVLKDGGLYTSGSVAAAMNAYVGASKLSPDQREALTTALTNLGNSSGMIVLLSGSDAIVYAVAS